MALVDPLLLASAAYTTACWEKEDWRQFGRETGTSDLLNEHPRLYRSQDFNDDDYPDAAADALKRVLREGPEYGSGELGRMRLLAESMPDLRAWVAEHGAPRTRRLFEQYLAARDTAIPWEWSSASTEVPSPSASPGPFSPEPAAHPQPQVSTTTPTLLNTKAVADALPTESAAGTPSIFMVHGHDDAAQRLIRMYVYEQTGSMPISLAEEPGGGTTIIEKFERDSHIASFVLVLMTPDDVGQTFARHKAGETPSPRARQNVVLELGYFIGKLGRSRVAVLDANVERPSDLAGLSYVQYPGINWKDDLRKELKHAGLTL